MTVGKQGKMTRWLRTTDSHTDFRYSIPNPLSTFDTSQVLGLVENFVRDKNLEKFMRLFKTAALIAHHPDKFELINESIASNKPNYTGLRPLEEEELEYLRDEYTKRFHHPRELYLTVALCSVGAAVQ